MLSLSYDLHHSKELKDSQPSPSAVKTVDIYYYAGNSAGVERIASVRREEEHERSEFSGPTGQGCGCP